MISIYENGARSVRWGLGEGTGLSTASCAVVDYLPMSPMNLPAAWHSSTLGPVLIGHLEEMKSREVV
jgi:hypothetical protein